jgi:hypothetical protein
MKSPVHLLCAFKNILKILHIFKLQFYFLKLLLPNLCHFHSQTTNPNDPVDNVCFSLAYTQQSSLVLGGAVSRLPVDA